MSSLTKSKLVNLYKKENHPKVKERLLLIIKVREDRQIPLCVAKDMHRSNNLWASDWLKRYDKEGIKGLKDRTKSGRPSELSQEAIYQIIKELKERNHGWATKQVVEELIIKKSGIKYHYTHIPCIFVNGVSNKRYHESNVNTASKEEEDAFKKSPNRYLWMSSKSKSRKFSL